MGILNNLSEQKPDPVLGLSTLFKQDERPQKTNLTVGVYCTGLGITPTFKAVRKAELALYEFNQFKTYLPILGTAQYKTLVSQLILGHHDAHIATAYAPGGTGALRMSANLIARSAPQTTVWISNPTWANHPAIFKEARLNTASYQYEHQDGTLNTAAMIQSLNNAKPGDVVVLHTCCHNPTGTDPDIMQWELIFDTLQSKQLIPLFDTAYQGFAKNQEADIKPIRQADKIFDELMVTYSFSKTMGLYAERVGALTVKCQNKHVCQTTLSNLSQIARTTYSNPPMHGLHIAQMVMESPDLRQLWVEELQQCQQRLVKIRTVLQQKMQQHKIPTHGLEKQHGLFYFFPVSAKQVKRLRDEFAIYILESGRTNIAGLNDLNIDPIVQAITTVMEK